MITFSCWQKLCCENVSMVKTECTLDNGGALHPKGWWRRKGCVCKRAGFVIHFEGESGAGAKEQRGSRLCNRFWHSLRPKEERSRACCNYNVDIRGFQRVYLSLLHWRKWARLYFKCIHIHSREGLVKLL